MGSCGLRHACLGALVLSFVLSGHTGEVQHEVESLDLHEPPLIDVTDAKLLALGATPQDIRGIGDFKVAFGPMVQFGLQTDTLSAKPLSVLPQLGDVDEQTLNLDLASETISTTTTEVPPVASGPIAQRFVQKHWRPLAAEIQHRHETIGPPRRYRLLAVNVCCETDWR